MKAIHPFLTLILLLAAAVTGLSQPKTLAAQMAMRGAWQYAQEQPVESFAPRLETLALEAGADVFLGMANNEPTIAADPNNPLHVAVVAFLGIRVSTNGGVTFRGRVGIIAPPDFSAGGGGDSSLGYDSQGRLFWTFLLYRPAGGNYDLFLAQCNPDTGA